MAAGGLFLLPFLYILLTHKVDSVFSKRDGARRLVGGANKR